VKENSAELISKTEMHQFCDREKKTSSISQKSSQNLSEMDTSKSLLSKVGNPRLVSGATWDSLKFTLFLVTVCIVCGLEGSGLTGVKALQVSDSLK
jgi:hypothetical protein